MLSQGHLYAVTPATFAPYLEVSLRHVWGWYPPLTTSHIHKRHIQSVWAIGMLSQGHMGAPFPFYQCTIQVGPRFGNLAPLVEWEWCHCYVMFEADIHIRPLLTSYKVFEPLPLVCCLKGIWMHLYTSSPYKLAPDLGVQVWSGNDAITSCLRLISILDHFQSVWATVMLSQGHMDAHVYQSTAR